MAISSNDVALLVHACDSYEFLYKGFESFFLRHWDFSIPCNCYFATEEKRVEIKYFQNLQSGSGEWSDRLKTLLDKIPEKYILYFQEDMWLNKDVNQEFFTQLFEKSLMEDWKQIKLHSSEVYTTTPTKFFIEGFNISKVDIHASDYLMSHQVTLWKKEFLLQQLPPAEHPWRNERKGSKRLKASKAQLYHADYFAENGKPEINNNDRPVKRSEYRTISVNGTLNADVVPFISVLQQGSEIERRYGQQLQHHYENNLTHDGKPRPRKEDVFKKIKNWIKKG